MAVATSLGAPAAALGVLAAALGAPDAALGAPAAVDLGHEQHEEQHGRSQRAHDRPAWDFSCPRPRVRVSERLCVCLSFLPVLSALAGLEV